MLKKKESPFKNHYKFPIPRPKPVQAIIKLRLAQYILVSLSLLFGYLYLRANSVWSGNLETHTLFELTASILSFFVGSFSLIKFYTRQNNKYLYIGLGFLYAALINFYHTYITYSVSTVNITSIFFEENFSQHASGFILSIFAVASIVSWFYEKKFKPVTKREAFTVCIILIFSSVFFILAIPVKTINILTSFLFLAAFLGYLYKRLWHFKYFEHWFILSLLVGFVVQIMYLSTDNTLGAMFMGAHVLKVVVYTFSLIGLLISMNIAFKEVETAKETMEAIVQSIGNPVFITDASEKITLMNSQAEQFSEISFKDAKERPYFEIFRFSFENNLKKTYPPFVKRAIEKERVEETEHHTVLFAPSGEIKAVAATAAPIFDKMKNIIGCIVVMKDMSKQRELEKIKDNFLSVAAHQLRTPLGAIRWNLEMMLTDEHGALPAPAKKIVSELHEITIRFINIVNDLLNVSRIDQLKVFDQPAVTDVVLVLDECIAELKADMARKQVSLLVDAKKEEIPKILIDKTRLKEIINNLLSNAVKYNKRGGTVTARVFIHNKHFHFEVSDTGIGIPKEAQEKIFEKFFRAVNAAQIITDGSGLGLFVVKSYVEGWGGTVSFKSLEGKGSKFVVKLPLKVKKHDLGNNLLTALNKN